jgi:hypothetical protein
MERLTVSIDPALLDTLKQQADAAGTSVSAYTVRALRSALLREELRSLPAPDPEWVALSEEARGW